MDSVPRWQAFVHRYSGHDDTPHELKLTTSSKSRTTRRSGSLSHFDINIEVKMRLVGCKRGGAWRGGVDSIAFFSALAPLKFLDSQPLRDGAWLALAVPSTPPLPGLPRSPQCLWAGVQK